MGDSTILPEFTNPPVVELALDVQFEILPRLRGPQLGLFWASIRDRFPVVEEQGPLSPMTAETFGRPSSQETRIELSLLDVPPVPRFWFLNQARTELVQVQPDRFIVNWRRVADDTEYPHYHQVRGRFTSEFEQFMTFVSKEGLGEVIPNQCAVTYFNHITAGRAWRGHGELDKIFTAWKVPDESSLLPEPDDVRLSARYVMTADAGEPLGRLSVELQPSFRRSDNMPIYVLTLTARGRPDGNGTEGILRFFDSGHRWASRAFIALTTQEMHDEWGAQR
jgi:uncharacterized protein (TIGR04255 family)